MPGNHPHRPGRLRRARHRRRNPGPQHQGPTWLVAMAAESGKMVTWDEALHSNIELAPRLDKLTMQSPPPVKPDATGHYPIAMPGFTTTV